MRVEDLQGQQVGRYQVISVVGLGGMAAVYRAHDPLLRRDVALKVLYPQYTVDTSLVERFKHEAVVAAQLDHPNIVSIYDVGEVDGLVYIAMQLINGRSVADVLYERMKIPLADLVPIIEQIASALDFAHTQGVVHRDIKAANILLEADNVAMLTDFGIAKSLSHASGMTSTSVMIGTPDYMAPEQISREKVSPRTDVYALGVLVFRCLTGRQPFEGGTEQVLLGHLYGSVPTPSSIEPSLPSMIDPVVQTALSRTPDERYETAGAFARALRDAASGKRPTLPLAPKVERKTPPQTGFTNGTPLPIASDAATIAGNITPAMAQAAFRETNYDTITPRQRRVPLSVAIVVFLCLLGGGGGLLWASTNSPTTPEPVAVVTETPTSAPTEVIMPPTEEPVAVVPDEPTPTEEPVPTEEPTPTETSEPTVVPTNTVEPLPTNTPVPPTATPIPPTPTPTPDPCPAATSDQFSGALENDESLRERIGCAQAAPQEVVITEMSFERGSMIRVPSGNSATIYVITRDRNSNVASWSAYPDTWQEGDDVGGGDDGSGQYPTRGFGKIWNENLDVGNSLGYATSSERSTTGVYQSFATGFMLYSSLAFDNGLVSDRGVARNQPVYIVSNDGLFTQSS